MNIKAFKRHIIDNNCFSKIEFWRKTMLPYRNSSLFADTKIFKNFFLKDLNIFYFVWEISLAFCFLCLLKDDLVYMLSGFRVMLALEVEGLSTLFGKNFVIVQKCLNNYSSKFSLTTWLLRLTVCTQKRKHWQLSHLSIK